MFLATVIGNSNIVVAIHDGNEWIYKFRYESMDAHPELFYETSLRDLLLEWSVAPDEIKNVGISSVVPELTERIAHAIAVNIRKEPTILNPELFMGLNFQVPKIYEIGSDLVANAVAVQYQWGKNSIVVDFGTALSFTVFDMKKGIVGVTIAPGLKTLFSTLSENTALLPEIDAELPDSAIGESTSEAINAGVMIGFYGMVRELIGRIKSELSGDYQIVATGELSTVIKDLVAEFDVVNKNLTLDGIRILVEKTKA